MADVTMTEFEHRCWMLGWDPEKATYEDFHRVGGNRHRMTPADWETLMTSQNIYKMCEVCGWWFCVNLPSMFPDRKPRTPRIGGLIICIDCDPRHHEDRYLKEGYRLIHPRRVRILRQVQVARAMATHPCMKKGKKKCKCPSCTARKVLG